MSGTRAGGLKAAATNKAKYGDDFFRNIGRSGGHWKSPTKGFGSNKEAAKEAGRKGGLKSKKNKETY